MCEEQPRWKRLVIAGAGKGVGNRSSHSAGGMWNGAATLENSSAISYHVKHPFTMWPRNSTAKYLLKKVKMLCSHKVLFMNVNSYFIQKAKKLYTTIYQWVNGQRNHDRVVCFSATKRSELVVRAQEEAKNWVLSIRNRAQKERSYHIIWFLLYETLEKSNLWWQKAEHGCLELEVKREIECQGEGGSFGGDLDALVLIMVRLAFICAWEGVVYYVKIIPWSNRCQIAADSSSGSSWLL